MLKLPQLAAAVTIVSIILSGSIYVAALAGDLRWLPIASYKQEKLYDLQDELFEYDQQEKWEGPLTARSEEAKDRLVQRIDRLAQELE